MLKKFFSHNDASRLGMNFLDEAHGFMVWRTPHDLVCLIVCIFGSNVLWHIIYGMVFGKAVY